MNWKLLISTSFLKTKNPLARISKVLSISGMAVGCFSLIVALSVMNGFESLVKNKSLNTSIELSEIFPVKEESLLKKIKNDIYLCKGRLDNQIKLNGYRIHLIDVEAQIKKNNKIEDCMCILEQFNEQKIICAILISKIDIATLELRDFLKNKLPSYMIPRKVLCIKEKPINKNGKLDRVKLKYLVE